MNSRGKAILALCFSGQAENVNAESKEFRTNESCSHISSPAPSLCDEERILLSDAIQDVQDFPHIDDFPVSDWGLAPVVDVAQPIENLLALPRREEIKELNKYREPASSPGEQRDIKVPSPSTSHVTFEESGGSSDDYIPSAEENESTCSGTSASEEVMQAEELNTGNQKVQRKSRGRKKTEEGSAARKRKRAPEKWEKNKRKALKAKGKGYTSLKGVVHSAKTVKAACNCRRKCFEKFSVADRQRIFENFYALPIEGQNQYIASSIKEEKKQVQRLRQNQSGESRRKYTRHYYVTDHENEMIEVCQIMFLNTLDLTLKKVRVITEKKRNSQTGMCSSDGRGKHGKQPKVAEETKEIIRQHINMFPAYQSHYSRSHTTKKYLASDLSIAKMYSLYVQYCEEKKYSVTCQALYRQLFVEEFNLSFHKPQNDTCGNCDKLDMLLKTTIDATEATRIQEEKQKHLELADSAYQEKKSDKLKSQSSDSNIVTISFDLQKCLATPFLKSGISFYKRKLWTLNLTIFETSKVKNSSYCYLWNETIANRGGQEIASCLYLYLLDLPENVTEVYMYSDCCPGQNKNIFIAVMLLTVVEEMSKKGRQLTLHHKFLIPGHTHMEADTIHAAIEKTKKTTTANIYLPRDWANLIRMVPKKPPIRVIEVQQYQFLNFKNLLQAQFQHRKVNTVGEPVAWPQLRWMQYRPNEPGKIFYKNTFKDAEVFKILDLKRNRVRRISALIPISDKPLQLATLKLQNLKELLPYIDAASRQYYRTFLDSLSSSPIIQEFLPDEEFEDYDLEELE